MFPRNLTLFSLPPAFTLDTEALEEGLRECALKPVGASELFSSGFVSPFGRDSQALSHCVNNVLWLTVGTQSRALPPSAVENELRERIAKIEESSGTRLGGRARKRLKEDVILELLPRAFVSSDRINAFYDMERRVLFVDTASKKSAENVVSEIRHALGAFPAVPVNPSVSPSAVLTGWIAGEPLPQVLSMGEEAELADPVERGALAKLQRHELQCDEVRKHLEAGKKVTRLGLNYEDRLAFVLGEDLVVRKLKFLEGAIEEEKDASKDDIHAELDARFTIAGGELRKLLSTLESSFQVAKAV